MTVVSRRTRLNIKLSLSLIIFLNTILAMASPPNKNPVDFFVDVIDPNHQVVTFQPISGMGLPITGLHLHYFSSSDCYSGHAGSFYLDHTYTAYQTTEEKPFMLKSDTVYEVGNTVVRGVKISAIRSVLIRLISDKHGNPYTRFSYFIGQCEDQMINCCIAVVCSESNQNCLTEKEYPVQYIFWR